MFGSGSANMSLSSARANPWIEAPSNPTPCSSASASSEIGMATLFRKPRISVNHSRTNRTFWSRAVFNTKSRSVSRSRFCILSPCRKTKTEGQAHPGTLPPSLEQRLARSRLVTILSYVPETTPSPVVSPMLMGPGLRECITGKEERQLTRTKRFPSRTRRKQGHRWRTEEQSIPRGRRFFGRRRLA